MLSDRQLADRVMPTTRGKLLEEWESDPKAIIDRARDSKLPLDSFLNAYSPPSRVSPAGATEWLLFNNDIRTVDTPYQKSSLVTDIPSAWERGSDPKAALLSAHWDEKFFNAVMTGERTVNALAPMASNTVWNPIVNEQPYVLPRLAPPFRLTDILGMSRRISDPTYRLNKITTKSSEMQMLDSAESTLPQFYELGREFEDFKMRTKRLAVEATYEYLSGPVRVTDITRSIEGVGILYQDALLREGIRLIVSKTTSGTTAGGTFAGIKHVQGKVSFGHWKKHLTSFGTAYRCNLVLGNPDSITKFWLMSITDGENLSLGSFAMLPETNIRDLNGDITDLAVGWVDKDNTTNFTVNKLWTCQRETTLGFVQGTNLDQDETVRDPELRTVQRYFSTGNLFCILDENGMKYYDFNAASV